MNNLKTQMIEESQLIIKTCDFLISEIEKFLKKQPVTKEEQQNLEYSIKFLIKVLRHESDVEMVEFIKKYKKIINKRRFCGK